MRNELMKKDKSNPTIVNWDEIRNKVNSVLNENLSQDEILSILKERAQALSAEKNNDINKKEYIEIIEFSLASETYGIETKFIREVFPLKNYTSLPGLPPFVLGIMNVRGQIISVIDLKKFFNLPEKGLGDLNKVIIIKNERMEFGILADIIIGTLSVSTDSIQNSPISENELGSTYIKGATAGHIIILDTVKILEDEKNIIHQEVD